MSNRDPLSRLCTESQIHSAGAAAVILLGVVGLMAAAPAWSRWSRQIELEETVRSVTLDANATRSRIDSLRRDIAAAQAAADVVTDQISATIDRRLLSVSSAAAEHGVAIDSIEPASSPQRVGSDQRMSVAVSATGSYPSLVSWLHTLRGASPDLTVQTLQISSSSGDACACRLTLNWWMPPSPTATAVADVRAEVAP